MRRALISRQGKDTSASATRLAPGTPSAGLRASRPHDAFEREADRVADGVMANGRAQAEWSFSEMGVTTALQRKCSCGGSPEAEGECEECKKKERLQRRADGCGAPSFIPSVVYEELRSPGQPLDAATRALMEGRFGHDFSQVRVHTGARAAQSAAEVSALAYTVGREVVFGAHGYQPSSLEGSRLIAHELTHVLQQRATTAPQGITDDPAAESEANRNAESVGTTGRATVLPARGRGGLQRQPKGTGSASGLDPDDQKIVDAAQREASHFKCNVSPILWGILNKHFPDDTRKLAGTGCESALPGLRTEFSTTDPTNPKVTRSVPMLEAGKAFIASTDAAHLKDRVADVGKQIEAIDDWRLAHFLIDEKDLPNPRISGQLRSMSPGRLIDYRDKTKDSEVKRYAENLLTFSTPTQAGSAVDPLSGEMVLKIGNVNVVIVPDVRQAPGVTGADTGAKLELNPPQSPAYSFDAKGIVSGFPGYTPTATLRIVTRYEAGVKPEDTSGYGRGTTAEDIRNKATALRFHEGSHGEDYLNFVRNNPLPVFMGKNGDKVKDFKKAEKAYWDAVSNWGKLINDLSKKQTDCVGKTIDQYHKGDAGYKPICP